MGFPQKLDRLFFNGRKNGTLMECGAIDGIKSCVGLYFEQKLNWSTINVEANPNAFADLVVNRPNQVNLNLALSDKVGEAIFRCPNALARIGHGTIEKARTFKRATWQIPVQTTTYSNVIAALGIEHLDLFVLDVEEHELSVLRGMEDCPVWPEVFVVETNKPSVSPEKVLEVLAPKGYVVAGGDKSNTYYERRAP
jgi:FkbM family methyltransferase